jgi:negative modulator of initiation of replication
MYERVLIVDEDVFRYVIWHMEDFKDTPSKVLRRLLKIPGPGSRVRRAESVSRPRDSAGTKHELRLAIDRAPWLPFDVQRYLYLLQAVERRRPRDFHHVLAVRGRTRVYFARTEREIEKSGKTTEPRAIPGTPYWALTNMPTREKQRILRNILTMLGFGEDAMLAAREYLARARIPVVPA